MPETQCGIAGHGSLARDDLTNPVRWHGNLPCELGRRDTQIIQLVLEDFSGMNGSHEHCLAPFFSDSPRNAPLLVDANGVLAGKIAFQSFETVSRQGAHSIERERRVQDRQPSGGLISKHQKGFAETPPTELPRRLSSILQDNAP